VNTLTACAGSDEVELTEIPLPIPDFDLLIEKCSYDEATLDVGSSWESVEWFDGNTNTSWLAQAAGTYPVTIEQLGCSATVAIVVEDIVPPPINLGLDREMCLGDSVLLSAGFPVEWQGGDFSTDYMAHEEGDYVARSYLNGCFNADTISVNVVEPPNLNLPFDTTLCQGNNLILQAYFTGVWNTGEVDNALVVDQPGTYTIAVTQGPCVVQDSVVVNMLQLPFVSIGEYDRYCDGESYELTAEAENSDYYSWSTGDSTSSIVVEESMEVNVTVGNVCGTSTSSVEIVFEDCSAFIYMPTSFTPNGDGINDEYWPIASNVKSFELSVYDRWGRTVFQSNSIDDPWLGNTLDGRYFVPNGQYNYHLICTTDSGNAIERSGYITVVR
jgi:gliding motility-associated-like protein